MNIEELINQGKASVVDVRSPEEFQRRACSQFSEYSFARKFHSELKNLKP